jgi:hypothetical protein
MDNPNQQSYVYNALLGQFRSPIELGLFNLHYGIGAPASTLGANNDFYLRGDGTAAGNTVAYHKEGGSWVALTT